VKATRQAVAAHRAVGGTIRPDALTERRERSGRPPPADVNRFIDLLLNAAQSTPVSVVATVRADFYDRLISYQKIQALLPMQQVLLGSMSRADLESTIIEPAKMVGLAFHPPGLVSLILDDVGENEGCPCSTTPLRKPGSCAKGAL
jgi:hypothetical protein